MPDVNPFFKYFFTLLKEDQKFVFLPPLAGNGNSLMVCGPFISVEPEDLFCCGVLADKEQVAADHDSGAAFSGLAMDDGHIFVVLVKVLLDFITKGLN